MKSPEQNLSKFITIKMVEKQEFQQTVPLLKQLQDTLQT